MAIEFLGWVGVSALGLIPGLIMRDVVVALFGAYAILGVLALETQDTGATSVFILASIVVLGAGANWAVSTVIGGPGT